MQVWREWFAGLAGVVRDRRVGAGPAVGTGCAGRREQARQGAHGHGQRGAADRGRSSGDRLGRTLSGNGSYSFSAMLKMKFATISNCGRGATCGGAVVVRIRREGAWRCGVLGTMVRIPGQRLRGQLCVSRCRSTRAAHRYKYLYLFVLVEVEHLLLVRQRWFYLDLLWLLTHGPTSK